MRDLHNQVAVRHTLLPAVVTDDAPGATVDRRGFESVEHVVTLGASGDTLSGSVKFDLVIEHSNDDSNWDAAADADVIGGTVDETGIFATVDDPAEDEATYRIGYVGGRRYSRVRLAATGTHSSGTPVSAHALLGHAHVKPV